MGIFDMFKKKDEFSDLKDPLSDPLGKMPDQLDRQGSASPQNQQDLPPLDMPGMPKDETGIPTSMDSQNTSSVPLPTSPQGFETGMPRSGKPQTYEEEVMSGSGSGNSSLDKRDAELISAKLDSIRSQLENINTRIANLERKAYEEETPKARRYNW